MRCQGYHQLTQDLNGAGVWAPVPKIDVIRAYSGPFLSFYDGMSTFFVQTSQLMRL